MNKAQGQEGMRAARAGIMTNSQPLASLDVGAEITEIEQKETVGLHLLKEQLAALTPQQKLELAQFLTEQARLDAAPTLGTAAADHNATARKRAQHMAWLKANREQYAGRYVALDGDRLVGSGATLREASEQARRQGVAQPFLVHVSSEHDAPPV